MVDGSQVNTAAFFQKEVPYVMKRIAMYKQLFFIIMFLLVFGVSGCASIVKKKIKLTLDSGEQIVALYAYPKQKGTYPAVIFNHGTGVRSYAGS